MCTCTAHHLKASSYSIVGMGCVMNHIMATDVVASGTEEVSSTCSACFSPSVIKKGKARRFPDVLCNIGCKERLIKAVGESYFQWGNYCRVLSLDFFFKAHHYLVKYFIQIYKINK